MHQLTSTITISCGKLGVSKEALRGKTRTGAD